jgi:hypothetical protein
MVGVDLLWEKISADPLGSQTHKLVRALKSDVYVLPGEALVHVYDYIYKPLHGYIGPPPVSCARLWLPATAAADMRARAFRFLPVLRSIAHLPVAAQSLAAVG